jgi:hypothetical protein
MIGNNKYELNYAIISWAHSALNVIIETIFDISSWKLIRQAFTCAKFTSQKLAVIYGFKTVISLPSYTLGFVRL